jgi:ATP-dependent RNA helicase SUPV3L1/SUV3
LLPAVDLVTASTSEPVSVAETGATSEATSQPAPAEPELVEVWRPGRAGRPEGKRRPRFRRREADRPSAQDTNQQTPAVAAADGAAQSVEQQPAGDTDKRPERHQRPPRRHRQDQRRQDQHRLDQHRPDQHRPEQRFDRQQRDRSSRDRDRPSGKPARFERRERDKAPDPNSPFAKLAALKAQLEADAKERR